MLHYTIESVSVASAEQLDKQCIQLAHYFVDNIPVIIKKWPSASAMPLVIHYRINVLLTNFTMYWMFLMLQPQAVHIDFFDFFR